MTAAVLAHDLFCLYPSPTGHVAALRGLSLEVAAGERVVVHGPNGSGKTSLLRVLSGERAPSAGIVQVAGVDLMGAPERERAALRAGRLGLVDQHHARTLRPELDVLDNVALQLHLSGTPRRAARSRAMDVLARLGLEGLATRPTAGLSGGEAQRVAVCAALVHDPVLVLADEPTGELDRTSAEEVYDLLSSAVEGSGAALLLVTHDAAAARVADRMVRIRDGRLSEEWAPHGPGPAGETLVVDDRGWVRLPEPLRADAGVDGGVRARRVAEGILLTGAGRSAHGSTARPRAAVAGEPAVPDGPAVAATAPAATSAPAARAEAVTVSRGDRAVLDAVSVALPAGALSVVRGPSGSGKTTLLRTLVGLVRPDSGRVLLGDTDLATLDREALAELRRGAVAVAGQGGGLVEALDVVHNLSLARDARGLPDDGALVDGCVDALGLHGVRHRPVGVLSGGERQRVQVARTLAVEPRLAVLDEPTSHQDEANAERVVAALRTAAATGMAVVTATHDPLLVAAADQVVDLGAAPADPAAPADVSDAG